MKNVCTGNVREIQSGVIYECEIKESSYGNSNNDAGIAHVVFNNVDSWEPNIWLLSKAVTRDGRCVLDPPSLRSFDYKQLPKINLDKYHITVLCEAKIQGYHFKDINEAARNYNVGKDVIHIPTVFPPDYYIFSEIEPPLGTLEYAGEINTKNGKKEVYKYSHSNRLHIKDCQSGASVDIDPSDLAEYYTS